MAILHNTPYPSVRVEVTNIPPSILNKLAEECKFNSWSGTCKVERTDGLVLVAEFVTGWPTMRNNHITLLLEGSNGSIFESLEKITISLAPRGDNYTLTEAVSRHVYLVDYKDADIRESPAWVQKESMNHE